MKSLMSLSFLVLLSGCGGFIGLQQNSSDIQAVNASRPNAMGMIFRDPHRGGIRNRISDSSNPLEERLRVQQAQPSQEPDFISVDDLRFLDLDEDIFSSSFENQSNEGPARIETDIDDSPLEGNYKNLPVEIKAESIESKGIITPSVYFFATMNEDRNTCADSERKDLVDPDGKLLDRVCPKTLAECEMQGSCLIRRNGKNRLFNIHSKRGGVSRFFEMIRTQCRYGYGVRSFCLDPFYNVAADLKIYKPGDVLFVPGVVGAELPDGSKHTGYFVVRDRGRAIIGKGRFDFYSGFISWRDPQNPFVRLGLSDKRTRISYYKIRGELANKILRLRGFPHLPKRN